MQERPATGHPPLLALRLEQRGAMRGSHSQAPFTLSLSKGACRRELVEGRLTAAERKRRVAVPGGNTLRQAQGDRNLYQEGGGITLKLQVSGHRPDQRTHPRARSNSATVLACSWSPVAFGAFPAQARAWVPSRIIPSL